MFYSQFILAKKGPLATIWIAAHLERKLRKNQITDTNIGESVDSILYPEVPIALRLSGHLLLGVVRIYSRKVNLLFNDCSDALVKIHQAFQSSAVDLPPGAVVAPFNSITLPESFDFDDLEAHLTRENVATQVGNRSEFEHHVTARDLITLQDQNDDRRSLFSLDERFEDAGNPYAVLDFSIEELVPQKPIHTSILSHVEKLSVEDDVLPPLPMEGEMDFEGMNIDNENEPQIETVAHMLSPFPETTVEVPDVEKLRAASEIDGKEYPVGLEVFDMHKETSVSMDVDDRVPSMKIGVDVSSAQNLEETPILREEPTPFGLEGSSPIRSPVAFSEDHDVLGSILGKRTPKLDVMPTPVSTKRSAKKRKHNFDNMVSLSSSDMKKQLKSTSDICRDRRKAPSTEYEIWMSKRDNHIEQNFSEPSFPGLCDKLKSIYDGVISKRFVSLKIRKHPDDQASLRKTPQAVGRLDQDGVDGLRTVADTEPAVEEAHVDEPTSANIGVPSTMDNSSKRVEDADTATALREEPLPPVPEVSFDPVLAMDDGGAVDNAREQDGDSNMEQAENANPRVTRESEVEAAVSVDDQHQLDGSEEPRSYGLGFLADSKDADDYDPENEITTNKQTGKSSSSDSGWSARSRAVALYLKEKFEAMETGKLLDESQNRSLSLERLLTGRTRKEAARLFFETLVLGTKGYIQVEQASPYADIQLSASRRLLKAAF